MVKRPGATAAPVVGRATAMEELLAWVGNRPIGDMHSSELIGGNQSRSRPSLGSSDPGRDESTPSLPKVAALGQRAATWPSEAGTRCADFARQAARGLGAR